MMLQILSARYRPSVNIVVVGLILLCLILGCSGKTDDTEVVSNGVITFMKRLKYGSVGTHGSQGFYVASRHIMYKNDEWTPPEGKKYVDDISSCETSPNSSVKVLKCVVIKTDGGGTILIREKNDQPETQQISEGYDNKNEGEWVNFEGRWLLFRNYLFNVETGERKDIKQLPEDPGGSYRSLIGMSPDMKTAVFQGKVVSKDDAKERLVTLRLIDIDTGKIDERPVNATRNPWIYDSETRYLKGGLWIGSKFIWEKDALGRDKLVFPELLAQVGQ